MRISGYSCVRCGARFPANHKIDSSGCPSCRAEAPSNLRPDYPVSLDVDFNASEGAVPSLWRYHRALPIAISDAVSLGEGLTPLVAADRLGAALGIERLLIKDEGRNPTWSHKDRFTTLAVSHAVQSGAKIVATASSGNAGASLAAYAARAGLKCIVSTFASTSGTMVSQIERYGAQLVAFKSKIDRWRFLAEGADRHGWFVTSPYQAPVVGSHPVGIEGYKTIAYELYEQMQGSVPDWCVLPVCYGDALAGLWGGFTDLLDAGRIAKRPCLIAAEIYGSLAAGLATSADAIPIRPQPFDTLAVSIGAPQSTFQALKALREAGGRAISVDNHTLLSAQRQLAETEGLLVELASAATVAAAARLKGDGLIGGDQTVVLIATASGLKDLSMSGSGETNLPVYRDVETALATLS